MPLSGPDQRAWKQRLVRETLERVGGLDVAGFLEPIRAPAPDLGYRNRVEFCVRFGGREGATVGLREAADPDGVVAVDGCLLQHETANAVLQTMRAALARTRCWHGPTTDFRVMIRRSDLDGAMLIAIYDGRVTFPAAAQLAATLRRAHPKVVGVVRVRAVAKRRGGARVETLAGRPWLEERVAGMSLLLPASSFLQVNVSGATELVRLVAECAAPVAGLDVLDLYGGVGLYARQLVADGARRAIVCEADAAAVEYGRAAAERVSPGRVAFVRRDVGAMLGRPPRADVIVANPPRRGLGVANSRRLRAAGACRLVLVSCDPATLARDLAILTETERYRVSRLLPVDLFPQTSHVEVVALLRRVVPNE